MFTSQIGHVANLDMTLITQRFRMMNCLHCFELPCVLVVSSCHHNYHQQNDFHCHNLYQSRHGERTFISLHRYIIYITYNNKQLSYALDVIENTGVCSQSYVLLICYATGHVDQIRQIIYLFIYRWFIWFYQINFIFQLINHTLQLNPKLRYPAAINRGKHYDRQLIGNAVLTGQK